MSTYKQEAGKMLIEEIEGCKKATDEAIKKIAEIEDELAESESTCNANTAKCSAGTCGKMGQDE